MNILISNDDGIAANGIRALTEVLSQKHNVYVIARIGKEVRQDIL